jgi:hypothetical protein
VDGKTILATLHLLELWQSRITIEPINYFRAILVTGCHYNIVIFLCIDALSEASEVLQIFMSAQRGFVILCNVSVQRRLCFFGISIYCVSAQKVASIIFLIVIMICKLDEL